MLNSRPRYPRTGGGDMNMQAGKARVSTSESMLLFIALCALLAGSTTADPARADVGAATGRADEGAQVRANQIEWGRAWQQRNAREIIAHYAPDAVLFVPGQAPVRGVAAFKPFIESVLQDPDFSLSWTVERVEVAASGDLAYLNGSYRQHNPVADNRKFVTETGSYVTVLRKIGGRWRAVAEINAADK